MDLSLSPAGASLPLTRLHPDDQRRRRVPGRPAARDAVPPFSLPCEDRFDSAAPVAVDAVTEAAVADLKPMADVPLAEAIHRYVDES